MLDRRSNPFFSEKVKINKQTNKMIIPTLGMQKKKELNFPIKGQLSFLRWYYLLMNKVFCRVSLSLVLNHSAYI